MKIPFVNKNLSWVKRNNILALALSPTEQTNAKSRGILTQKISVSDNWFDFDGFAQVMPNPDPVLKSKGIGTDVDFYREILTDPQLYGVIENNRKPGVTSLLTSIENANSTEQDIKFYRAYIESLQNSGKYMNLVNHALDTPQFGRMVFGLVWGEVDGKFMPVSIEPLPHQLCKFNTQGEFLFSKDGGSTFDKPDHPARFIVLRHKPTLANPYGEPLLSKCYYNVFFKKNGFKFWAVFMEKYGMPWTYGKYDAQKLAAALGKKPDEVGDALFDSLHQMVQDGVFVSPKEVELQVLQTGSQNSIEIYNRIIRLCDEQNTKLQLGHSGASESTSGDKLSNDTTVTDVRDSIILSDKQYPQILINSLFYWIYQFNFSGTEIPQFKLYDEEDVDKSLAERDAILVPVLQQSGLKLSQKYLEKNYAFGEGDIEANQPESDKKESGNTASTKKPTAFKNINEPPIILPTSAICSNSDNFQMVAETDSEPEDQITIDKSIKYLESLEKDNATMMAHIAKPILDFVENGKSLETMLEDYYKLFPKLDTSDLLDLVERVVSASHLHGSHSAKIEDDELIGEEANGKS